MLPRLRAIAVGPISLLLLYLSGLAALFGATYLGGVPFARAAIGVIRMAAAPLAPAVKPTRPIASTYASKSRKGLVTLAQSRWSWGGWDSDRRKRSRDDDDGDSWGWRDDDEDHSDRRPSQRYGGYQTVCVRLCDGYYWPISFSTPSDRLARDAEKCEASCGSPARLFRSRPGAEPDEFVDLNGQPYSRLKTAFLYRTKFDANCKCRPNPWEREALDRHRMYALERASRKGDKTAANSLKEMKAAQISTRKDKKKFAAAGLEEQGSQQPTSDQSAQVAREDMAKSGRKKLDNSERMALGAKDKSRPGGREMNGVWRQWANGSP